ncbi:FtsB family cell division protein [Aestuariivirga sp.]|uniref:FtsB family cell division protein n=1 Tax=Aestuariivirga sp. TaxID=2650926 RepID=UPI0039E59D0D
MTLRRFDFAVTCACAALLGYFAWHAFEGPRGFANRDRLQAEVAALSAKAEKSHADRNNFEAKVALLRPDSIDPDLLDEMARQELNLTAPGDVVVMNPTTQSK